mgnify:CR=1 FL=1
MSKDKGNHCAWLSNSDFRGLRDGLAVYEADQYLLRLRAELYGLMEENASLKAALILFKRRVKIK